MYVYQGKPYQQTQAIGVGTLEFSKERDGVPIHTEGQSLLRVSSRVWSHDLVLPYVPNLLPFHSSRFALCPVPSSGVPRRPWAVHTPVLCAWAKRSCLPGVLLHCHHSTGKLWLPDHCSGPLLASPLGRDISFQQGKSGIRQKP